MTKYGVVVAVILVALGSAGAQPVPVLQGDIAPGVAIDPLAGALYEQLEGCEILGSINSQNFTDAGGVFDGNDCRAADDFVIPPGPAWIIRRVQSPGVYGTPVFTGGPATSVNVTFFADAGGLPGAVMAQALNVVPSAGLATGLFVVDLPVSVTLSPGTYWVSVQSNQSLVPQRQWFWQGQPVQSGSPSAWENPGDGFGTGCTTFMPLQANCVPEASVDRCFALIGVGSTAAPAMGWWGLGLAMLVLTVLGWLAVRRRTVP